MTTAIMFATFAEEGCIDMRETCGKLARSILIIDYMLPSKNPCI